MKPHVIILVLAAICSCTPAANYVIGVSQCSEDLWRDEVNKELRMEAMLKQDIELTIKSVQDDSERQIDDIEQFIADGVDLIVVSPNESSSLTPVISKAYNSGIPVILFDRKTDNGDYTAFIGANNYRLAYQLGTYLAQQLNYSGNVVIIRGLLGSTADSERYEGFMDAMKLYPGIRIAAERHANYFRNEANSKMGEIIDSLGTSGIDAVFAMNDQMAAGADDAIRAYNSSKRPFIIGIDGLSVPGGGLDAIGNGKIDASFIYPTGGDRIMDVAYRILKNMPFERENTLNSGVIDRTNYKIYKLQSEQIAQRQRSLDELSRMHSNSLMRFGQQKITIYILIALTFFAVFLMVTLFYANRAKKRMNDTLHRQNDELNEMSQELKSATHAKLAFFTDISHEFKTPLTLIMGPATELMKQSGLSPDERELLLIIQRNASRLMSLLNQILEFRTYENGKMALRCSAGRLDRYIEDINALFTQWASQKQLSFSFDHDGKDYSLNFDHEKFEKIYFNILSNAFKFVLPGGVIRVTLRLEKEEAGPAARISVFNSGSYIPKEKQADIFRRFCHLENNTNNSGIGLALAKALATTHKGHIEVESEELVGTTFTIVLPAGLGSNDTECAGNGNPNLRFTASEIALLLPQNYLKGPIWDKKDDNLPKILIIEDNEDMRRYLFGILRPEYHVILASNGEEGIDKALKSVPSAIVSDVMMPKLDGYAVAAKLKNNVITADIPVILLTAYDSDEQRLHGYECGADAYIVKPFNADILRVRVKNLLEKRKRSREQGKDPLYDSDKTYEDGQVEFLGKIKDYIEANAQRGVSIDELCEHLCVSKSKLYRQLKEITDYSPIDIVNIIRLRKSVNLMLNERKTISEAAYETGFNSPSYFTKMFVRYYGEKPSDYIKHYTSIQ